MTKDALQVCVEIVRQAHDATCFEHESLFQWEGDYSFEIATLDLKGRLSYAEVERWLEGNNLAGVP